MGYRVTDLTVGQAAARLGVSYERMKRFVKENNIETIRKYNYPDKINFVQLEEKWIAANA